MFKWDHYLEVANELIKLATKLPKGQSEAAYRSAISRAYYAAYNKARIFYNVENNIVSTINNAANFNGHYEVWKFFKQAQYKRRLYWNEIGEIGNRLRDSRNVIDYQVVIQGGSALQDLPLPDFAQSAIEDAQIIINKLDHLEHTV